MSNRDIVVIGGASEATVTLKPAPEEVLGRLAEDVPAAILVVLDTPAKVPGK